VPHVYEERTPKAWSITCVTIYLLGVAWMAVTSLPDDLGPWLAVSGLFLLVLLPCLAVPISKHVYHRIRLTPETLRVGRERIAVAALDPGSIRAAYEEGGRAAARRIAESLATNEVPRARRRSGTAAHPRLVGGAWGTPMGMAVATIATRDGEHLCVATRDRDGFLLALLAVTGQSPAPPGRPQRPAPPPPPTPQAPPGTPAPPGAQVASGRPGARPDPPGHGPARP
jgi:hypothetical protein